MPEPLEEQRLRPEDLPSAQRGLLDERTLAMYVRDLKLCASNLHVRLKAMDQGFAQERAVTLDEAIDALTNGQACGAQIRYFYQGDAWADTITASARGLEITRLELPSGMTSADNPH